MSTPFLKKNNNILFPGSRPGKNRIEIIGNPDGDYILYIIIGKENRGKMPLILSLAILQTVSLDNARTPLHFTNDCNRHTADTSRSYIWNIRDTPHPPNRPHPRLHPHPRLRPRHRPIRPRHHPTRPCPRRLPPHR